MNLLDFIAICLLVYVVGERFRLLMGIKRKGQVTLRKTVTKGVKRPFIKHLHPLPTITQHSSLLFAIFANVAIGPFPSGGAVPNPGSMLDT